MLTGACGRVDIEIDVFVWRLHPFGSLHGDTAVTAGIILLPFLFVGYLAVFAEDEVVVVGFCGLTLITPCKLSRGSIVLDGG